MASFFDKLNLRPAERRVLVAVMLALFVVVNLLWVWPRFGDWKKAQNRFQVIETKVSSYGKLIKDQRLYETKLREFETESQFVPAEDQVVTFMSTFQNLAPQCGVFIRGTARTSIRTNENFIEHVQRIPVMGDEAALVTFLYRLGDTNATVPIRVKELSLHAVAPQRQKLEGDVTLVASFQRKLNLRAPVPAARPATGAAPVAATAAAKSGTTAAKSNAPAAKTGSPAAKSSAPASKIPALPAMPTNKPPTQVKK